ncbi:hypothetical protein D3C80_1615400 [compost metagenome]
MEPGMAYTSRPCSPARRAVINEPLATLASTTSTPSDKPLMMRLRRGKLLGLASAANGNSETTALPWATIAAARER